MIAGVPQSLIWRHTVGLASLSARRTSGKSFYFLMSACSSRKKKKKKKPLYIYIYICQWKK